MLTIMSVTEITRNGETFVMKDKGLEGFVIEYEEVMYYCELTGYPFVRFRCFDDYSKFFDIDCWLHFSYSEKCDRSSLIRDDERMFYNSLKEVEKIVDYCKKIEIVHQDEDAFLNFFIQIDNFIREYEDGFKHDNKKIEKKFNKVAKDLKKVSKIPAWFKYR